MVNTELLETRIRDSGLKKGYLAERCGLSRAGFWLCLTNQAEFRSSQVKTLCDELGITRLTDKEAIFFAPDGAFKAPDRPDGGRSV